jgi:hypothetical protein
MRSTQQTIASIAVALALLLPLSASAMNSSAVSLNSGNLVTSSMNSTIDSGSAHVGDRFTMTVLTPYPGNNGNFTNAQLYGHVTNVVAASQGKNPVLAFNIDRIVLSNGRESSVSMQLQSQQTQRHNNLGNIAVTAVGGMIVGNMVAKTLFKSSLGGPAGLIAGALYANNKKTNVSLRQGSVVVTEVMTTVALLYPNRVGEVRVH